MQWRDTSTDNAIILGEAVNSNLDGFIYVFHLWNTAVTDFSTDYLNDSCGNRKIANCLWSCTLGEWIDDNGVATSCDTSCSYGCIRNGSCNICYDPLCKVCKSFGEELCDQCIANASGSPCRFDYTYTVS